jgi:hypothetical protein
MGNPLPLTEIFQFKGFPLSADHFNTNGDNGIDQIDYEAFILAAKEKGWTDIPAYDATKEMRSNVEAMLRGLEPHVANLIEAQALVASARGFSAQAAEQIRQASSAGADQGNGTTQPDATTTTSDVTTTTLPGTTDTGTRPEPNFIPPANVLQVKQITSSLSSDDIKAIQQRLVQDGENIGTFGGAHDGVDGIVGKFTSTAILDYLIKHDSRFAGKTHEQAIPLLAAMTAEQVQQAILTPATPASTTLATIPASVTVASVTTAPIPGSVAAITSPQDNGIDLSENRDDQNIFNSDPNKFALSLAAAQATVQLTAHPGALEASGLDKTGDGRITVDDFDRVGDDHKVTRADAEDLEKLLRDAGIPLVGANGTPITYDPAHAGESVGNLVATLVDHAIAPARDDGQQR